MRDRCVRCLLTLMLLIVACSDSPDAQAALLSDEHAEAIRSWLEDGGDEPEALANLGLPKGLDAANAAAALDELWALYRNTVNDAEVGELPISLQEMARRNDGQIQLQPRVLSLGDDLKMPFAVMLRESQAPPEAGRPLFICTHGGGQRAGVDGPHAWPVNTREWQTQIQLAGQHYPSDGVYVVPRMADDRLGRWWHKHNHVAFERIIEQAIAHWGVDPNRVYLVGISEGGYGTAILAPYMPDRFGGANAMAAGVALANPPENLRNLAFRTDVGERDNTFERKGLAVKFHEALDKLHAEDEQGYLHSINVQPGRGHGIDYRPGIAWIAQHQRDPWPQTIVWTGKDLDGQRRSRMYWVQAITGDLKGDDIRIRAHADRETNTIDITAQRLTIEGDGGNPTHAGAGQTTEVVPAHAMFLRVLLHDELLDMDRSITVICNGEEVFVGKVERDARVMLDTLAGYGDPAMAARGDVFITLD